MNGVPAELFPAGELLADELDARGWTQAEFAEILGRPAQFVSEIVSGKKEITRQSAAQIGAALGTSAELWLNLQDAYLLWKQSQDSATQRELDDVRIRARLNELAPMSVLRKRGIITSKAIEVQATEIKKLFKLESLWDEPRLRVAARRGNCADPLTSTQKAWLACVERALPDAPAAAYSAAALESVARRVSRIVREPSGFLELPDAFAEIGVRLVFVEAFPGSKLSGASILLDDGPVIALSGLRQRLDVVLFTLLHEAAHVFRDDITTDGGPILDDEDRAHTLGSEEAADLLAAEWILPQPLPPIPNRISQDWVSRVAAAMGVHPIVIVGQLQKKGALDWRTALVKGAPNVAAHLRSW